MIFSDEGQPVGAARDQLVTTKHGNFQVSVRTAPDPVQVSEATNGRLVNIEVRVIFNELSKKKCGDIRISFLKGVKAEHLTDADMKAMRPGIQQAKHWRAKPPSSEPVVNGGEKFSWVIQGSDSPLPDKGLTILFGKVKVNSEIGSTPIVVEFIDGAKAGETAPSATFRIGKMPSGFTFHSLVAASNYIEAGHSAVLTWQMSGAADLSLGWVNSGGHGTMSVNQAKGYKPGDCRVETPQISEGTMFGLTAHHGAELNSPSHTLYCAVYVKNPDLEVGHLGLHGASEIIGTVQEVFRFDSTSGAADEDLKRLKGGMLWEAETDGIINVQFQAAPQSTSASITLKTKGRDNLEPVPWTVYSSPLGDQAMSNDQINIPIRRRSQVQLEALGHNQGGGTGEMISLHQLDIIFTPFGVGKLVEIAKKE